MTIAHHQSNEHQGSTPATHSRWLQASAAMFPVKPQPHTDIAGQVPAANCLGAVYVLWCLILILQWLPPVSWKVFETQR